MAGGEFLAFLGRTSLEQRWRPLHRRLGEKCVGNRVVFTEMGNGVDLGRIGKCATRPVVDDRVVFPTAFPQLVDNLHEFVCHGIALVMSHLLAEPKVAGSTVAGRRYDVPAHSPLRQMIQRRHFAGEGVGLLV